MSMVVAAAVYGVLYFLPAIAAPLSSALRAVQVQLTF